MKLIGMRSLSLGLIVPLGAEPKTLVIYLSPSCIHLTADRWPKGMFHSHDIIGIVLLELCHDIIMHDIMHDIIAQTSARFMSSQGSASALR